MKIVHLCLASFYIDNYGYQENVLPKAHMSFGLDVEIIASTETYGPDRSLIYVSPSTYINSDGIKVTRLAYNFMGRKVRGYLGLFDTLLDSSPDIIFMHDAQFFGVFDVIKFVKLFPNTTVYSDCHTDYINSGKNFFSKYILHKIIYRFFLQSIEPYVKKFYGVTPLRSQFLIDVYGIPESKVEDHVANLKSLRVWR